MSLQKFGTGKVLAEDKDKADDDVKTASKAWTAEDDAALKDENSR